jgi:ribonuclease HI
MCVPPWLLLKATFDLSLAKYGKSTIPAELFRRHFAEVTSKYPEYTHIFTDGSVSQGSTGCSFFFDSRPFTFHLHSFCTIFTAELYALYRSLLHIRHLRPGRFLLCTDSLSSLHALSSRVADNPLVVQSLCITSELLQHGHTIVFCWIPGHTGIPGNVAADAAARDATLQGTPIPGVTSMDFGTALRRSVLAKWQRDWDCTLDNKLREVKPVVHAWGSSSRPIRRDEVVVARFRIGHTRLTHGHLLSGSPPPVCTTCDVHLSVRHILVDCPRYAVQRDRLHLPHSMRDFLADDSDVLSRILNFLRSTDIFHLL